MVSRSRTLAPNREVFEGGSGSPTFTLKAPLVPVVCMVCFVFGGAKSANGLCLVGGRLGLLPIQLGTSHLVHERCDLTRMLFKLLSDQK